DIGLPAAIAATALILQHFVAKAGWEDRGKIVLVLAVVPCLLALPLVVRPRRFTLVLAALMAIAWYQGSTQGTVKYRERTFFGVPTVIERPGIPFSIPDDTGKPRTFQVKFQLLNHNTTRHGMQSLDPAYRMLPTSYYHRSGPLGQVFDAYGPSLR